METAKLEALHERDNILATGRHQLQQEQERVKQELRAELVTVAVAGAEKILKHSMNDADHAMLLSQWDL